MTERNEVPDEGRTGTPPTPPGSLSRRSVLATVGAASLGSGVFPTRALAATPGPQPGPDAALGPDRPARLQDEAWVETPVDTNDSGRPDRVYVRVTRPESTDDGDRLPVIATASPYYGNQTHSDATPAMRYDRAVDPAASEDATAATVSPTDPGRSGYPGRVPRHAAGRARRLPASGTLEQRYVDQRYVVARVSSLGTHRSTGCYTAAGPKTIAALEAVVDWFNGRVRAYTAATGGDTVAADWTNGRTGFVGASAEGELANGLATTGVDGLEAIVAQAANNGQYALFRSNGTPITVVGEGRDRMADLGTWVQAGNARRPDCAHWTDAVEAGQDRETGNFNDFWAAREFLPDAANVDAAVLLTHAVDDRTVKPNNTADWYEELTAADVPLRLWLHEGGHTSPGGEAWRDLLDRWWAYWLKDADNGVVDEDPVTVVRGGGWSDERQRETYADWPVPDARATSVSLRPDGTTSGGLSTDGVDEPGTDSLVDDSTTPARDLVATAESDHRLRYETPVLGESIHVSGRVVPSLSLSLDEPTVVSVALVSYQYGGADLVTRGWVDPLNRPSYGEFDSPVAYRESLRESRPLDSGDPLDVEFPLQATDYVFEAGSRLGLVIYASDRRFTLHPPGNATVTVDLSESTVTLPVAGGADALASAVEADPPADDGTGGSAGSQTAGGIGPGVGVGAALSALGGATYLAWRGRDDGE